MENENKLNYSMKRYREKENNRYNKKPEKFKKHKKEKISLS